MGWDITGEKISSVISHQPSLAIRRQERNHNGFHIKNYGKLTLAWAAVQSKWKKFWAEPVMRFLKEDNQCVFLNCLPHIQLAVTWTENWFFMEIYYNSIAIQEQAAIIINKEYTQRDVEIQDRGNLSRWVNHELAYIANKYTLLKQSSLVENFFLPWKTRVNLPWFEFPHLVQGITGLPRAPKPMPGPSVLRCT